MIDYKIQATYSCEALKEISIDTNGYNFLIIFGKHINGYYIAIPNHNICVEAACGDDTFYNEEKLIQGGVDEKSAEVIAKVIRMVCD